MRSFYTRLYFQYKKCKQTFISNHIYVCILFVQNLNNTLKTLHIHPRINYFAMLESQPNLKREGPTGSSS